MTEPERVVNVLKEFLVESYWAELSDRDAHKIEGLFYMVSQKGRVELWRRQQEAENGA